MTKNTRGILGSVLTLVLMLVCTPLLGQSALVEAYQSSAPNIAWNVGDVFVADVGGQYKVYDNAGVYKQTISDGLGGTTTGCSFDAKGDLYTTDWTNSKLVKYSGVGSHEILQIIDTTLQGGQNNRSIVFAANGDFYVGQANFYGTANGYIQRYKAAGVFQQLYRLVNGPNRSDWIDLANDQQTIFYTSKTSYIRRYDVSGTGAHLVDFARLDTQNVTARALRLLPPGDGSGGLIVADTLDVRRLDGSGKVVETFDAPGEDNWEGISLDPNGTSFWSGDISTGHFYRFNIARSTIEIGPIAATRVSGICVKGEITAAHLPPSNNTPNASNKPAAESVDTFVPVVYVLGSVLVLGGLVGLGYYVVRSGAH